MLTSLPAELRLQILQLSIGEHTFEISAFEYNEQDCTKIQIILRQCFCCSHSKRRNLQALAQTSRLLASEANEIFYRQTRLIFASARAADIFVCTRPTMIRNFRSMTINCGPAKHLPMVQKAHIRRVFSLLQDETCQLTNLHLCFRAYYGIDHDRQLLSNFWHSNVSQFRSLKSFSINIDLDMLGPIGAAHVSQEDQAKIKCKIRDAESILRIQVYQPRDKQAIQGHSKLLQQSSEAEWIHCEYTGSKISQIRST